jgi:uncharacterized protein (AIM24 family)
MGQQKQASNKQAVDATTTDNSQNQTRNGTANNATKSIAAKPAKPTVAKPRPRSQSQSQAKPKLITSSKSKERSTSKRKQHQKGGAHIKHKSDGTSGTSSSSSKHLVADYSSTSLKAAVTSSAGFDEITFTFEPGKNHRVYSENGSISRMDEGLTMEVGNRERTLASGVASAVKHAVAGQNLFKVSLALSDTFGKAATASMSHCLPGKIIELQVKGNESWACSAGSLIAYSGNLRTNIDFDVLGLLTGEFTFTHLELEQHEGDAVDGPGRAWVSSYGDAKLLDLKDERSSVYIDSGMLLALKTIDKEAPKVETHIMGDSVLKGILSREGFVMKLTGPCQAYVNTHNVYDLMDFIRGRMDIKSMIENAGAHTVAAAAGAVAAGSTVAATNAIVEGPNAVVAAASNAVNGSPENAGLLTELLGQG